MAQYVVAQLHGGPLDGQLVHVPCSERGWPERNVGLPVPVLDEETEMFWWDTGNYFRPSVRSPRPGERWWYSYSRTLPGYPTFSEDHNG